MLKAVIIVCSLAAAPDCNMQNAIDFMRVPSEFGSPVTCLMHGQAFLAATELGRSLTSDQRVRVVCNHLH